MIIVYVVLFVIFSVVWIMLKILFKVNSRGKFLMGMLVVSNMVMIKNDGLGMFVWLIVLRVEVRMMVIYVFIDKFILKSCVKNIVIKL